MIGIPVQELLVIVEAKGCGKYSKQLYNMVGTNDDDGETVVGPRDGSVQASIFDENKFKCNQLSSEQKVVFIGTPRFAKDYLEALDSLATDKFDKHGIHMRIGGKHASVFVDKGVDSKEAYWDFLEFAESKGQQLTDLLAMLRCDANATDDVSDRNEEESGGSGVLFGSIAKGAKGLANKLNDKASVLRRISDIEDQKFQFAIKLFYLEKLRSFVES